MCEDYPCCGHESGDCPDSKGRMRCVECRTKLKAGAKSSICPSCTRGMSRRDRDHDLDFDYSMNG